MTEQPHSPNTAADLGRWVRAQVAAAGTADEGDIQLMARVIASQVDRWKHLSDAHFVAHTRDDARTSDMRWDALLEGLVALLHHRRHLHAPAWTQATALPEVFDPYAELQRSAELFLTAHVLATPPELLAKGVVFAARNLERL